MEHLRVVKYNGSMLILSHLPRIAQIVIPAIESGAKELWVESNAEFGNFKDVMGIYHTKYQQMVLDIHIYEEYQRHGMKKGIKITQDHKGSYNVNVQAEWLENELNIWDELLNGNI